MKKLNLLVVSTALLMTMGLAACGNNDVPASTEPTVSSSEEAVDYAALAKEAFDGVTANYDKWATNGLSDDVELVTKATAQGKEFVISWSVADSAKAYLAVVEEGGKTMLKLTRDSEDHMLAKAVKAEVKFGGEVKYSKELNAKVVKDNTITIANMYKAAKGDTVQIEGVVTRNNVAGGKNFIINDGTAAAYIYTSKDWTADLAIGAKVQVVGTIDIYSGLYEVKPDAIKNITKEMTPTGAMVLNGDTNLEDLASVQSRDLTAEGLLKDLQITTASSKVEGSIAVMAYVQFQASDKTWKEVTFRCDSRYATAEEYGSWAPYFTAADKKLTAEGEALIGKKVSLSGYMGWYNAAQVADSKLLGSEEWTGEKPAVPAPAAVSTTIANLLAKEATDDEHMFTVSGIFEGKKNDKYGNAYLTDPVTGDSIAVYGSTTTETALAWNNADKFVFTNPQDAVTTLADIAEGEKVTMNVIYKTLTYSPYKEIMGVITGHETVTNTYTASVSTEEEGAVVSLSKTEGIAYGEAIEVTGTKEGKQIGSVKVTTAWGNTKTVEANGEGKYIFNATVVNNVAVTFKDDVIAQVVDAELKFTGTSNTDMAAVASDYNTALNLPDCYSVIYNQGAPSSKMALRTDGIRMYGSAGSSDHQSIKVKCEGTIASIVIAYDSASYSETALVKGANGETLTGVVGEDEKSKTYVVNGDSFTLCNDNSGVASAKQVRFKTISITVAA